MTALPLSHPEPLEIHVEEIRKGWFRAWAGDKKFSRASRTEVSWIVAAAYVWKITRGSMAGFDDWVAFRLGVIVAEYDSLPGVDDLEDFTIHGEQDQ